MPEEPKINFDLKALPREESPRLQKWPFVLGDVILLILGICAAVSGEGPAAISVSVLSVSLGACLLATPYVLEYVHTLKQSKNQLEAAVEKQFFKAQQLQGELEKLNRIFETQANRTASNAHTLESIVPDLKQKVIDFREDLGQLQKTETADLENIFDHRLNKVTERLDTLTKVLENLGAKIQTIEKAPASSHSPEAVPAPLKPQAEPKPSKEAEEAATPAEEPQEEDPELLPFQPEEKSSPPGSVPPFKLTKGQENTLNLMVNANVGLGNYIYIRGDGPELSWEKGTQLELTEIGKWQWKVENVEQPAVCRVYKNDEVSAYGDDIEVPIGLKVEVFPIFPED